MRILLADWVDGLDSWRPQHSVEVLFTAYWSKLTTHQLQLALTMRPTCCNIANEKERRHDFFSTFIFRILPGAKDAQRCIHNVLYVHDDNYIKMALHFIIRFCCVDVWIRKSDINIAKRYGWEILDLRFFSYFFVHLSIFWVSSVSNKLWIFSFRRDRI